MKVLGLIDTEEDIVDKKYVDNKVEENKTDIINDLTSGGIDKALSAEMGKNLNELIISGLDNLASKLR